jgi:hypothetical protein
MWHILGQCIRERHIVNNVADLSHVCQQDWNQITIQKLQKLIRRMRCQCIAVVTLIEAMQSIE